MLVRAILLLVGLAAAATVGVNSRNAAMPGDTPPSEAGGDAQPQDAGKEPTDEPEVDDRSLHDFTAMTMEGEDRSLAAYKGKVVLVVNVASKCGLTPQYEALQRLYEAKKDEGLVVLAFPANNFGDQEPGTNEEVLAFCRERFDVTFPVFAKISVKGEDQHALYEWLTSLPAAAKEAGEEAAVGGEIAWNFTKFLFDADGKPVARFEPRTTPDDPSLVEKLDELLAALPSDQEGEQVEAAMP